MIPGVHPTALGPCDDGDGDGGWCKLAQLRGGYRMDLWVTAKFGSDDEMRSRSLDILERVGAAVDGAGPQRVVAVPQGASNPAALCDDPIVRAVITARGAVGAPSVANGHDPSITVCRWDDVPSISSPPTPLLVEVLPGAAWAMPRVASGIPHIMLSYKLSSDGSYLWGGGDGVSAMRSIGDDLVVINSDQLDGDPEAWDQLLAATW